MLLRVLVDAGGRPERVVVERSSGFPRLDAAAREAVMAAQFRPWLEDGRPQAMWAIVPILFQLDE